MTEGATIFELNFKANLNYALKLNRTKPNKNEKNQINYLQKPTWSLHLAYPLFLLMTTTKAL
jgi:hypothetical protein